MYKDNDVSMVVIVPEEEGGSAGGGKEALGKGTRAASAQVEGVDLELALPKFKLTEALALSKDLDRLGTKDAFIPGVADFKGMESGDNPRGSLFIKEVVHKAFVDVDEKGTEAAAATAVIMHGVEREKIKPLPPVPFRADHPFLFVIRHNATGSILFMGRVFDPRNN